MTEARDHLALVLDVPTAVEARELARRLQPWFGIAKVGYELYAAAGPEVLEQLRDQGFRVFADLKLHDIPTTVGRGAEALGRRGIDFLNFHAAGGVPMLRAGVEGLARGAKDAGFATPIALAVTVLTSDADTGAFTTRLDAAIEAGCDGVVCSAHEVTRVKERARAFGTMVPGIRREGDANDDQARVATPDAAIRAGADWLVIGRSVTAAADPESAAEAITNAVEDALASRRDTR
jgi:orotidine-5'-phosphate decarboxylase